MVLAGKKAMVIGTAQGICQGNAIALAKAGADVAACDLDAVGLEDTVANIRALGRRGITIAVDAAVFLATAPHELGPSMAVDGRYNL